MSDSDSLLTTIDDYLLSIAEGLHRAQEELDRPLGPGSAAAFGYYIPKLEFELRVTIERMERSATPGGTTARRVLLVRPVGADSSSSSQAVSVVRGSFVAVPNASRGALRASSSLAWKGARNAAVTVLVTDGAGTPKQGVEVHFNVDRDLSRQANQEQGNSLELSPETAFLQPVVRTDVSGRATSVLSISEGEPIGAVVVMLLDTAGQTEVIRHAVTGAS